MTYTVDIQVQTADAAPLEAPYRVSVVEGKDEAVITVTPEHDGSLVDGFTVHEEADAAVVPAEPPDADTQLPVVGYSLRDGTRVLSQRSSVSSELIVASEDSLCSDPFSVAPGDSFQIVMPASELDTEGTNDLTLLLVVLRGQGD